MIKDFNSSATDEVIFEADICIIGAGAAGITLARSLAGSGLRILLLESGGTDFEESAQALNCGESTGLPYYDLDHARLRLFGGTTNIWGGRVAELDAIDFERRSWVPASGWPFGKDELEQYYRRARTALDLPCISGNMLPGFCTPFDERALRVAFWQFDQKSSRFAAESCSDLKRFENVTCLLHATAVQLCASDTGRQIGEVRIANLHGGRGRVRARTFVLASGALEITRLLLASQHETHPHGIGNNTGFVGRCFMEHPHGRAAQIIPSDPKQFFAALPRFIRRSGYRYGLLLRPGETLQARQGILNSGFTLAVRKAAGEKQDVYKQVYNDLRHRLAPTRKGRALWQLTRSISVQLRDNFGPLLDQNALQRGRGLYALMRAEQAPNPESRVRLGASRDELGVPRLVLDWRLSEIDKHTVRETMRSLDRELQRLQLGSARPAPWVDDPSAAWEFDPLASNHPIGGYHHMGTTRMAAAAADGVTNENCRVHGVSNLFIASTSLFPTAGWANPMLTQLALTFRLADHLIALNRSGLL